MDKKSWKEFKDTGLLWFINGILHLFGWALVIEQEKGIGKFVSAYPARVKFRGFDEDTNTNGYKDVTKYLKDNVNKLMDESYDKEDK